MQSKKHGLPLFFSPPVWRKGCNRGLHTCFHVPPTTRRVLVETQVSRRNYMQGDAALSVSPRMSTGGASRELNASNSNKCSTFVSRRVKRGVERRIITPRLTGMSKQTAADARHGHGPLFISSSMETGSHNKKGSCNEPIYSTSTPVLACVLNALPSYSANVHADADSYRSRLLRGMSSSSGSTNWITHDNNTERRIINMSAAVNRGCTGREQQKRHYYSLGVRAPSLFLSSRFTRYLSSHSFLSSFHTSTSTPGAAQRREFSSSKADLLVNEQICFPRLRVVDVRGFVGDFDLHDALKLAREKHTDLVLIDTKVVPPLARLTNAEEYAKELAEKEKRRLMMETPSDKGYSFDPALKVKGMRISATADPDDVERKLKRIIEFLEKGHRVDVTLMGGSKSPWYRGEGEFRMPKFVPKNQLKRSPMHPVALLAKRVIGDTKELAKVGSSQRGKKAGILKLWPCTPEQAARSRMPTNEELEELYGGYSQEAHQVDEDFFQFKKRERARQIEEFGVRKQGVRKENRKPSKEDEGED